MYKEKRSFHLAFPTRLAAWKGGFAGLAMLIVAPSLAEAEEVFRSKLIAQARACRGGCGDIVAFKEVVKAALSTRDLRMRRGR